MHREPTKDLAWLRVRASDATVEPLELGRMADRDQEPVWTYQLVRDQAEFEQMEIERRISAKHAPNAAPVSYWRLTKRIEPGLSGGALVDAAGKWIGIASGNGDGHAHYVDETELDRFVKSLGLK